jgi:hypothetical protein
MKESEVLKIFNGYKKQLIKMLGTSVTDNEQLEKVGYAVLGSKFKGVYSQDTLPVNKTGMYIMNNHKSSQPGEHWVAIYITAKKAYVWDSFGRKSKQLLKILYRNAKALNKTVVDADYDRDQEIMSEVCGPLSLAWLLTVKQIGITNALKV